MGNEWFVERTTYERTIRHPDTKAEAVLTMRPLNAGDRAEFNEIRLLSSDDGSGGGEGQLRPGRMQLLAVERAVVAWTIPGPGPTAEAIAQLDPRVFDQIYGHVSFGNPDPPEGEVVPLPSGDAEQRVAEVS